MTIEIGKTYRFNYPPEFTSLPEYTAHRGQAVTVTSKCEDGIDYDGPLVGEEAMVNIKATDGWTGVAWISELEEVA